MTKPIPLKIDYQKLKKALENTIFDNIREKRAIYYRYGLDDGTRHTLEETGHLLGVTRERIRQMEAKVFERIGGIDKYFVEE